MTKRVTELDIGTGLAVENDKLILPIETVFTEENEVDVGLTLDHPDVILDDGTRSIRAVALGKIKGTDWCVFKFDNDKLKDFKDKVTLENAKRSFAITDIDTSNFQVQEFNFENSGWLNFPAVSFELLNQDQIKRSTLPYRLGYRVNGQVITNNIYQEVEQGVTYYAVPQGDRAYRIDLEDGEEVTIELYIAASREPSDDGKVVKTITYYAGESMAPTPEYMLKSWNPYDDIYRTTIKQLYNYNTDRAANIITFTPVNNQILINNIEDFKQDSLPQSYTLSAELEGHHNIGVWDAYRENGKITSYRPRTTDSLAIVENRPGYIQMKMFAVMPNREVKEIYAPSLQGQYGTI